MDRTRMTVPRVVAMLALAAALFAQLAPTEARQGGGVEFEFDTGVSPADRADIREGTRLAEDFIGTALGLRLAAPIRVVARATDGVAGQGGFQEVTFHTGSPVWIETTSRQRIKIAVHEYFHVVQFVADPRIVTPRWLLEGGAEYVAYRAIIDKGLVSEADSTAFHVFNVAISPAMPPLAELETSFDFSRGPVYSLGYLAVELLVAERGIAALGDYYDALRAGDDQDTAFEAAFGWTHDAFYAAFATYRAGLLVPASPPASLRPPGPVQEYPAELALVSVTDPVAPGEQAVLVAATAPSVRCTLLFASADGSYVLSRPTQADLAGTVFWLWSVPDDAAPGPAAAEANCGGAPVATAIAVE